MATKCLLAIFLVLPLLLIGCGTKAPTKTKDKLTVYTSFYVMYDFASKIAGDHAVVINMMPPGVEVHDWEPTPKEIVGLESADIFIYNGVEMEGWVDKVVRDDLFSVNTSQGIPLLMSEEHEEENEDDHEGHSHGEYDSHLWLNPLHAKRQLEHIKNAFVAIDPTNATDYEKNYQTYAAQCDQLYEEFSRRLETRTHSEIVVSHEAYGYLCDAFGLTQYGVRGFSPEGEPSPHKMAEIIDFINENDIKFILFEESGSQGVAETIAKETGIEIALLSPVESISYKKQEAGADYFSVMRENLAALEKAVQ